MSKYKLTKEKKEVYGTTLFRIEATTSFGSIDKGDKGCWIEKESNLSQEEYRQLIKALPSYKKSYPQASL